MAGVGELMNIETEFWRSEGVGEIYERLMTDDGRCVLEIGILEKGPTVQAIEASQPWKRVEMDEVSVVDLGEDVAAICYRATATRGDDDPYEAYVSTAYRRTDDGWRMVLHQQTPVG